MRSDVRACAWALVGTCGVVCYAWLKSRSRHSSSRGSRRIGNKTVTTEFGSAEFDSAASYFSKNSDTLTADVQLSLYALYKQATCGDYISPECSEAFASRRRVMEAAWKQLDGMTPDDAQAEYIRLLTVHCPKWREGIAGPDHNDQTWASVGSMPVMLIGDEHDFDTSISGQLCALAAEGNLPALQEVLDRDPALVRGRDKEGMTCLHWACDRGHMDMVLYLLSVNSNINAMDHCGNTPLHIAAMAGQNDIVRILLDAHADLTLENEDGESAASLIKTEFPKLLLV